MATDPTTLTRLQQVGIDRAALITAEQLTLAEEVVDSRLPGCDGPERTSVIAAVGQMIATNYVALMTARSAPK